jgi:hypothetical protein
MMAFRKGSRYEHTKYFTDAGVDGIPFRGTRERRIKTVEGVLEHTLEAGQRLDLIALHYYNDDKKWWRILDANPHLLNAGEIITDEFEGETIVIPRS